MEFVTALRTLWDRRLLVALCGLLAVFAGLYTSYSFTPPSTLESKRYTVGIGSAMALVDTPQSQVADLGGGEDQPSADIGTLSVRASLLASVMTTSPLKEEIAAKAGIAPDKLIAIPPTSSDPGVSGDAKQDLTDPKAEILRVTVPNLETGQIPLLSVSTQSPDPETAKRLADQSIAILQAHLERVAAGDNVPNERRVVVRPLGAAVAAAETRGPSKVFAVFATIFVFGLGCCVILGVQALVRGWRRAGELERLPHDPSPTPMFIDEEFEPIPVTTATRAPAPAPQPAAPQRERRADQPVKVATTTPVSAGGILDGGPPRRGDAVNS